MKILVVGGTRYFGRHLINSLTANGHQVFVMSRTNKGIASLEGDVQHISGDRKLEADLKKVLSFGPFDAVYDQVCMNPSEAKLFCDVFRGQIKKLFFTSTVSVYDFADGKQLDESVFDASQLKPNSQDPVPYDYQYAKRMCEAIYHSSLDIPVVSVRFPFVIGINDYTGRLKWHVDKVMKQEEIYFPNTQARLSFVHEEDAGRFLSHILQKNLQGPINAASGGSMKITKLISIIGAKANTKAVLAKESSETNLSPYGCKQDILLTNKKAQASGFKFRELEPMLEDLIRYFVKNK